MSMRSLVVAFSMMVAGVAVAEDVYVEYVQSDRTKSHAVNVGYIVKPNTKVVVDYAFVQTNDVQQRVFGVTGADGSVGLQHYINGSGNLAYACYNNSAANWTALSSATKATTARRTFIADLPSKYVCAQQGPNHLCSHTHGTQVTNTANHSLAIFAAHNASTSLTSNGNYGSVKFYSMQIYEDGQIVMDLWPCKSDGKYCIKDRLTGRKFYEVNNKTLSGGAEVAPPASVLLFTS